ncbi:hypothetical protein MOE15_14740 [Bacillus atrophaeus]|uniref:hypothetical protein n=1 Tax=Bacillus atrophaeus TaxID=1452 RepID=UPI002282EF36|nr:hypothetical protein [Bacillus atrophaeus]MCY8809757.1 hypothetical protein [Bacillus atrophaeus]
MPHPDMKKARHQTVEALHCLTVALLRLLSTTVNKRVNTSFKEEIRLFSALCQWQKETGGRLLLMISNEREDVCLYRQHVKKMRCLMKHTKHFITECPPSFKQHPATKHAIWHIKEWLEEENKQTAEAAIKQSRRNYTFSKGKPAPPWFNQQLIYRKR